MKKLLMIANNNLGTGQSGGDTIFLNFIKYWSDKLDISLFASQETINLTDKYNLAKHCTYFKSDQASPFVDLSISSLFFHQLRRIFYGIAGILANKNLFTNMDYVYTVSDFYPDLLPGLLLKTLNPRIKLICGFYLIVPHPTSPQSPYRKQLLKSYFYYLLQKISLFLVNNFANYIFITSEPDRRYFNLDPSKVFVIRGGVDLEPVKTFFKSQQLPPVNQRKYDSIFMGRLHPQKGVLGLVDIWRYVVDEIPAARLAIIGDGQLEQELRQKISDKGLQDNIKLFGFQSGASLQQIIIDSKIVVHPAIFDSGGMSAAEIMAYGLPGVSYDLEALKTYYPQGMLKTPCFDQPAFAKNILFLLNDQKAYLQYSQEAKKLIFESWDWQQVCLKVIKQLDPDLAS